MSILSTLCLTLTPAELADLAVATPLNRCGCCGSRSGLKRYILHDLRLWVGCTVCAKHCDRCMKHLVGALEVPES